MGNRIETFVLHGEPCLEQDCRCGDVSGVRLRRALRLRGHSERQNQQDGLKQNAQFSAASGQSDFRFFDDSLLAGIKQVETVLVVRAQKQQQSI